MRDALISFGAEYLIGIVVLVFLLYFFLAHRRKRRRMLLLSLVSLPLTYIAGLIGGILYFNPRPFVVDHVTPLIAHAANNGFPSDHTLLSAALATIVLVFNRKLGLLLWALAFVVGALRVLAWVHHWVDIAGAAGIALIVVFFSFLLVRRSRWWHR